jgi:hypothetical protein
VNIEIELPTLHEGQLNSYQEKGRFKAIRCGRRWGKSTLAEVIACDAAARGKSVGIFAPGYKFLSEFFSEIALCLAPIRTESSKIAGVFRTTTGGRIDFWSLENESAGRSRKYHIVIIDEAAFTKPNMKDIWRRSIRPTLIDYEGVAYVLSNTNGIDSENFFWCICNEPEWGFVEYHAPSHNNPLLPREELEKMQRESHPLVYQQEILAEFIDWSGVAFFALDNLLVDGKPVEYPGRCDSIFCCIDTAIKQGKDHDSTAVVYCSFDRFTDPPLRVLDWDCIQVEGSLLINWIPAVFQNLAKQCGARFGSLGAFVEDRGSGTILLQQAQRLGMPAAPIESPLTQLGKDERALNVSGYVYRKEVALTQHAFDKVITHKGTTRNHLLSQITGFRIGDKDAAKRSDDLVDAWMYCIALSLGNSEGF